MQIIKPYVQIEEEINTEKIMRTIEKAGRTCYKSEHNITDNSAEKFIMNIIKRGHESVLEHEKITVRFVCDRGVSHELVRHRIASYSQESTRYCNYNSNRFTNEITCIKPINLIDREEDGTITQEYFTWYQQMQKAEEAYKQLINQGCTPDVARSVLPTALKTEIVVTMNLREWRHFFKLRTAPQAHADIRYLAKNLLKQFQEILPCLFYDIN